MQIIKIRILNDKDDFGLLPLGRYLDTEDMDGLYDITIRMSLNEILEEKEICKQIRNCFDIDRNIIEINMDEKDGRRRQTTCH